MENECFDNPDPVNHDMLEGGCEPRESLPKFD